MNQVLTKLYQTYWEDYKNNIRDLKNHEAAFPFLINVYPEYENSDKRIMICGQETQGWGNEYDKSVNFPTVDKIRGIYRGFVWPGGYNSPYWNFINKIKASNQDKSFIINNVVKIGKRHGAGCDNLINENALKYFPVNKEEISILKPHILIFLTGPNYDWRIKKTFGNFTKEPLNSNLKCMDKIVFDNPVLPIAIRCYHPGYIQRIKKTNDYLKVINDFIQSFYLKF